MDILALTEFFKYCSIINFLILAFASLTLWTSDLAYNIHTKLGVWSGSKEEHKKSVYSIMGNYKILIMIFNVVPYFVLSCFM